MKTINIWTRVEVIQKENSMITKALKKVAALLKPKKVKYIKNRIIEFHTDKEFLKHS